VVGSFFPSSFPGWRAGHTPHRSTWDDIGDENCALQGPEEVSSFYEADELSSQALKPLGYKSISPVGYSVEESDERYTVFVPPNLDSSDWVLDGEKATESFHAAWESQSGKVEYARFKIYEASYIISIISAVAIAVVYLIIWKKEVVRGKIGKTIKRLFRPRSCSRLSKKFVYYIRVSNSKLQN